VSQSTDPLPTDIATLQALLSQARAERDAVIADRNHLQSQNDRLQHLLRQLQRARFGRSSEKLDPDQLHLAFEDIEQAIAATEADDDKRDAVRARARAEKRRLNRGSLPAHLPRIHVTIEPDDTNCPCCQEAMHMIGEETSQRLDVIPAQFRVLVTHRPKYACRACEQAVVQAPAPERLIKGGLPTEAMVASVLVGKYAWHLPLYRQAQMLAAQGIDITRAVLAFWVGYAAVELKEASHDRRLTPPALPAPGPSSGLLRPAAARASGHHAPYRPLSMAACRVCVSCRAPAFDALGHKPRLPVPNHRFHLAGSPHHLGSPAAIGDRRMILARESCFWGALRSPTIGSSRRRSPGVTFIAIPALIARA
jgi:transposase